MSHWIVLRGMVAPMVSMSDFQFDGLSCKPLQASVLLFFCMLFS